MSQATRPVAASPETQQLIDLCFTVAEGKMDIFPQLEAAVSQLGFETVVIARPSLLAGDRAFAVAQH